MTFQTSTQRRIMSQNNRISSFFITFHFVVKHTIFSKITENHFLQLFVYFQRIFTFVCDLYVPFLIQIPHLTRA